MRSAIPLAALLMFAAAPAAAQPRTETALFAGGCFWSTEKAFDAVPGVLSTTSGYAGGTVRNPSYEQVTGGRTGHREAVRVVYDPARVSYARLLDAFWRSIDPTDPGGAFCDRGPQYRTAVFALTAGQRSAAAASREAVARVLGKPVATPVLGPAEFFAAEDYHQDYHRRNPMRYESYRIGCGRDRALNAVWSNRGAGEPG